jgi:membrane dipeptidase
VLRVDLFDLHCDTASCLLERGESIADGSYQVTLDKAAVWGRWAQVFAIFLRDGLSPAQARAQYAMQVARFRQEVQRHAGKIALCSTAQQMEDALAVGRCAAVLSVENGSALGGSLDALEVLAQDGVRLLTLTWFGENELGYGSMAGGTLKPFGRAVLKALPQYGIVPDVSHLSDEGVAQVFDVYEGVVVATHSNVRTVTGHCRNLTNAQIGEIVRRKGLIGLNLYRAFLSADASLASCDDAYRHVDAFLTLGAQDALCIGADFDGGGGCNNVAHMAELPHLYEYLLQKNLPRTTVDKIFFENAYRFWQCAM